MGDQSELDIRKLNKELELRVSERTRQLEALNKDLEAFCYSVSHDLRAPLRAIRGFSEILQRRHAGAINDQGRRYLGNIIEAGGRMEQLIDDLLKYSRFGRRAVQSVPVALTDVFQAVRKNLKSKIADAKASVTWARDWPVVMGDTSLLTQIFTNLLDNALTYRRASIPLQIEVNWRHEGNSIAACVQDNGIGIDPSFHERIFDLFQRLHTQEEYPGTGIGLGIVKKSVELIGASIRVESILGEGSRFYVMLRSAPAGGNAP